MRSRFYYLASRANAGKNGRDIPKFEQSSSHSSLHDWQIWSLMFYQQNKEKTKVMSDLWRAYRQECRDRGDEPMKRFRFTMATIKQWYKDAPEEEKNKVAEEKQRQKDAEDAVTPESMERYVFRST